MNTRTLPDEFPLVPANQQSLDELLATLSSKQDQEALANQFNDGNEKRTSAANAIGSATRADASRN
ncbi:hypothetical protein [Bradyrhizobium sp. AUGA SZCCT0283]|uniref:hypothetical protein n=1 Tax=Bradyrhizobium sp. AUGA SZCCT0283 TaxID=2807671 RepID=UPI001BA547E3|nr:hypothetical protein [Bradyrhizobium sp. AUGA SZCCT0283]MBR1280154.1 hypothetical protein [Bradyrhizobium sp. AUGA SZCCT0283]